MAVAAYASVLSLLRAIDSIQQPSHLRYFPDTTQVDALREKLFFLQDFLEVHSSTITADIEGLVREIPRVTYDVESLIDNYVVDQLYRELYPHNDVPSCCNVDYVHNAIHHVIQEIAPINEALKVLRIQRDQEQPARVKNKITGSIPLNEGHPLTSTKEKNKMVGFDDQLKQVLEKLTGNLPNLVIVPIVGMGGIGKTTLAKSVFDHPYNLHRFGVRIWLTISQDYSVKRVLQGLLKDGVLGDKKDSEGGDESEAELITQLYQKLFGQRYLIVLDDVWSAEAWDDLRRGFPDNGNGSQVMVTTRLSDIASSLGSQNNSYSMKFQDEDKSWDLFSEKAFEKGGRSLELEKIGRVISKRCKGLPLLLASIGALLASSNMKVEYWQTVVEDTNSFANDEYCLRVLSLSYHHLPIHLKPCFLYTRHFKEDSDIKVSELIKRWVSQGLVKPMRGKSLEEAARNYLEDLIGRNMYFLIKRRRRNGNIKSCGIHDLLRELSIKESNKEQFLELPKMILASRPLFQEVFVVYNEQKMDIATFYSKILGSVPDDKILVGSSCENTFPEFARSRFVKVLEHVPLPTTCRSITLHYDHSISVFHTLRLLWNLEFLDIVDLFEGVVLPKELWEMPQLRHVKASFVLPEPVVSTKNNVIVLENLQTLTTIEQFKFTEEIVRRIPNLRKLGVRYDHFPTGQGEGDWLCLPQKLESLYILAHVVSIKVIPFPSSLKKLTLEGCETAWKDLAIIGSLPNLEVLELLELTVFGKEWIPIEGEFLRLKYLKLRRLNLVHWRVDIGSHFPALETIFLYEMDVPKAIPREIGELPSLKSIYLKECHKSLIDSAKVMVEEEMSYGNEGLAVHVQDWFGSTYKIRVK